MEYIAFPMAEERGSVAVARKMIADFESHLQIEFSMSDS
jgi:hypothetical protein